MKHILVLLAISVLLSCCNNFPEDDNEYGAMFIVYPNPARDVIYVQVNNSSSDGYVLKAFSPSGRLILETPIPAHATENIDVSISNESDGYFHMVLDMGTEVITRKVLKV